MKTLSSCYFCGVAVDAAVEDYPLVRSEAFSDVETDQRIHLCPSCRRKLTTVIERVLEAAFDGSEAPVEALDPDRLRDLDAEGEMTVTSVSPLDDEVPSDDATAAIDTASEPEKTDAATEAAGATDAADQSTDGSAPDESTDQEDADTTAQTERGSEPVSEESTEIWEEGGESTDVGTDGESAEESPDEAPVEERTAAATDANEQVDTDKANESESSGSESDESRQYSKSEFNKIVRLLQNREFPVEIDELVVVSHSAYGIDEGTCHAVIDALIDRGVVADQGEELVRA